MPRYVKSYPKFFLNVFLFKEQQQQQQQIYKRFESIHLKLATLVGTSITK